PLFIRDYLSKMSRADLFVVMCGDMATIAGTMLVLYATILSDTIPDAAGHLLVASIISAPAAVMMARIMVPEHTAHDHAELRQQHLYTSTMDAITDGTRSGLNLFLNIIAMLLVLVALVQIVNGLLGLLPEIGGTALSLERMLGWLMAPIAWLMGVPWSEAAMAGTILGTKTVLNELLAYLQLVEIPKGDLSERTRLILTYALCGFANFGSLGIMIGGLSTLAPERRKEIVDLGIRSIVGGTLATCCTGAVVGLIGI
ncbi:MAG: NupC/NupG family nucleoside CNT transporter, partial [Gammaproteobacteria bacterium]